MAARRLRSKSTVNAGAQVRLALQAVLSKVVTVAQLGAIGIMLGGEQLFAALGLEAPQLYHQYKDKKFGVIMGCWFLGNALQNQLSATGAYTACPPTQVLKQLTEREEGGTKYNNDFQDYQACACKRIHGNSIACGCLQVPLRCTTMAIWWVLHTLTH